MERRRLGKTGIDIGAVVLGGAVFGWMPQSDANKIIAESLEAGVNYIDCAHSYGNSLELAGSFFNGKPDGVYLGAKSLYRDRKETAAEIERSLKKLRTDSIDIFYLHGISDNATLDLVTGPGGALEAITQARERGLVRFVGITGHSPAVQARALRLYDFDVVMTKVSYLYRYVLRAEDGLLPLAQRNKVGVLAIKTTAGTLIANTWAAHCYALTQGAAAVIPPKGLDQYRRALACADRLRNLTCEELRRLLDTAPELEGVCRQCDYCMPCPAGIDIPYLFRLEGRFRFLSRADAVKELEVVTPTIEACSDCGQCEELCPDGISVRQRLRKLMQDASRGT